ncbi:hypothetical protein EV646_113153 [Kribbella antiqua]|uniref:Alanine-rich protein n=1 Tax=Kribbella antiqua TaxID=2512217 RepID=A0A4R2ID65_9ACTN|nr:hypothetical protein [Kribbella antiqua]TCO42531.1 hypothetical protein EV646_113153 [Kribbella antiqua]
MPAAAVYGYPWDFNGDPAAPDLVASLGAESVVLAASYHSVRAATPRHPQHRVVEASAGLYVPVRRNAWTALVPDGAEPWAGEDSFNRAAQSLRTVGLDVQAWIVLTHNSAVGRRNPSRCVRNAFGDVYHYALCPAHDEVVEYGRTLVAEIVRQTGVTNVVLEACGPLGIAHNGLHEKTAGADWSPVDQALLSICFCDACVLAMSSAGLDVEDLSMRVRSAVGAGARTVEETVEEDVLQLRRRHSARLRAAVVDEARANGVRDIALHAVADPWATGAEAALDSVAEGIDCCIAPAWEEASVGGVQALARLGAGRIGAYVTALPPFPADAERLAAHCQALVDAGATDLHIYHAGLASNARLDIVRDALASI